MARDDATAETVTDEEIRGATCATCGASATCIGRYEDMDADEFACDGCCGHGCEDGHCDALFDEDGDVMDDKPWANDSKAGTRMRRRCAALINARRKGPDQ